MKLSLPQSLRTRLVLLVAISTLPAVAVMTHTAFERYYSALSYAYSVSKLASDGVQSRYQGLASRSRDVLALMAALPAVNAPAADCDRALAALRAQMPLYANLDVISLDGGLRCSAVPFAGQLDVSGRGWFKQMLTAPRFTSGVIGRGINIHRSALLFSAPHFDVHGNLIGTLNAIVLPEALAPPAGETTLARYGEITLFDDAGTVLMRYPRVGKFADSNQSHSRVFQALRTAAPDRQYTIAGLDGKVRIYSLRRLSTDVPGQALLIASGIDQDMLREIAFLPLARDLGIIVGIAVLIMLSAWWATSTLVTQRLHKLLETLQLLSRGETQARTELANRGGEFGLLAAGVDRLAASLESQAAARQSALRARAAAEQQFARLIEQAVEGITIRRPTGEYILVNAAFCKMLGYSRDELLHMRITDVIEPSEQRGHLLKPGESTQFESWMYHKDGHRVQVEASSLRLLNGNIQSVQRDISERLEVQGKLEENERQYRELVEQAMIGILVRRPSGEILFANRALCQITGYRRDELVGMSVSRFGSDDEAGTTQRINQVSSGESLSLRSQLRHKDGHAIHVELTANRLENGSIQVLIHDVSVRVEAEGRLLEERQFVLHALDVLPGGFYVFDSTGHFLRWNRQLEETTGYSMQEMQQINAADIVPPEQRAHHLESVQKILRGSSMQGETVLYTKDRRSLPYYYVAHSFSWRGQNCVVGMGVDISALKQAQASLQEEQRLLSEAVNSLPGLFSLCTNQGHFLLWNRRLEQLSGYSSQELAKLKPLDLIVPEQRARLATHIAAVFANGESSVEAEFLCRDGRRIPHYFTGRRLIWGGQTCLAGVALDITARREAEQRIQTYLQELQRLSRRILQTQEDERRHLAAELHDELGQNLLTVLLSLRDLENRAPAAQRGAIRKISELTSELSEQVRSLSLDLRPTMLDDLGLTATLRWYLRERVAISGLKVELDIDPHLSRLPAIIENTCFRVLQAALTNVMKHAQAHNVRVALAVQNDVLRISVQDDGHGFDVQAAQQRALTGKSFGLLGMQERVRFVGGQLEFHSAPGHGARLEVTLPIAAGSANPTSAASVENAADPQTARTRDLA